MICEFTVWVSSMGIYVCIYICARCICVPNDTQVKTPKGDLAASLLLLCASVTIFQWPGFLNSSRCLRFTAS